jgi:hypothetical protein
MCSGHARGSLERRGRPRVCVGCDECEQALSSDLGFAANLGGAVTIHGHHARKRAGRARPRRPPKLIAHEQGQRPRLTAGIIDKTQFSLLITVVVLSAVVPTAIAERWFLPSADEAVERRPAAVPAEAKHPGEHACLHGRPGAGLLLRFSRERPKLGNLGSRQQSRPTFLFAWVQLSAFSLFSCRL